MANHGGFRLFLADSFILTLRQGHGGLKRSNRDLCLTNVRPSVDLQQIALHEK